MCYIRSRGDVLPQLHLYIPEETADNLRQQVKSESVKILSHYCIARSLTSWPKVYFAEVVGDWVEYYEADA